MLPRGLRSVVLLALSVSAIPTGIIRRDDSAPNFVNNDGSIDFSGLTAAAAIVPTIVAPVQASNLTITVDTAAMSNDVVTQAADQADDNNAVSKRNILTSLSRRAVAKRAATANWAGYGTCGPQILFSQGPTVSNPDTYDAFRSDNTLSQMAKTAAKPKGYTLEYVALNGVYQSPSANSFLGSTVLTSAQGYNPQYCANYCDTKIKGCLGFNIYFERDPSASLDSVDMNKCNNPPSVTQIACQFFGSSLNAAYATSAGQVRGNYFRTAKAGSNGYSKATVVPTAISGFTAPQTFSNGKIDDEKVAGYIAGSHVLTVNPDFNPKYCADVANNYYAGRYASFETFMLKRNGAYVGQACIVLTKTGFTMSDANNAGQPGTKTDKGDETNIWYSTQPVYYYEASDLDGTFAIGSWSPAGEYYSEAAIFNVVAEVEGFVMNNGRGANKLQEDFDNAVIWTDSPSWWPVKMKTGNFGSCQYAGECKWYAQGFTFDISALDVTDLAARDATGNIVITGYRNSLPVSTMQTAYTSDWQTIKLDSSFTNLDSLGVTTPNTAAFDNLKLVRHK